jgi:alpha-beta hydrolase superfamily lysophospholipase
LAVLITNVVQEDPDRPLILICHSLGGIVAKNALIDARLDSSYQEINEAVKALVFFATPHQGGGNKALLGDAVVRAIRHLGFARNDIMEALRHDSIITGPINQRFRHLIKGRRVVSFIETQPMGHAGLVSSAS